MLLKWLLGGAECQRDCRAGSLSDCSGRWMGGEQTNGLTINREGAPAGLNSRFVFFQPTMDETRQHAKPSLSSFALVAPLCKAACCCLLLFFCLFFSEKCKITRLIKQFNEEVIGEVLKKLLPAYSSTMLLAVRTRS